MAAKRITINDGSVIHVREVADGSTEAQVQANFWREREAKLAAKSPKVPPPEVVKKAFERGTKAAKTAIEELEEESPLRLVEPKEMKGAGPCPFCEREFKKRESHIPWCKKGPGGRY